MLFCCWKFTMKRLPVKSLWNPSCSYNNKQSQTQYFSTAAHCHVFTVDYCACSYTSSRATDATVYWLLHGWRLILQHLYSRNTAATWKTNNSFQLVFKTVTWTHKLALQPSTSRKSVSQRLSNDRDKNEDTQSEMEKPLLFFNARSPVFLPFTVLWNFGMRWQLLPWLSSTGEEKNPISSIYKAKRKSEKKEKNPSKKKKLSRRKKQ